MTLFLDIDETLNSAEGYTKLADKLRNIGIERHSFNDKRTSLIFKRFIGIGDDESLEKLSLMIGEYKIDNIVISSSWRHFGLPFIKFMLYLRGFENIASLITDVTPYYEDLFKHTDFNVTLSEMRKIEILKYVELHNVNDYIILDDIKIDLPGHYLIKDDEYRTPIGFNSKFKLLID